MKQTLYDILGVARDASPEAIAAAGRQRIAELEAAPPHDPNALPLVREAHQILSNPTQRSAYDASLAARAARATVAPEVDDDDDAADPTFGDVLLGGWRKWALGLVVLVALAVWWKAHTGHPSPGKVRGIVVQQTELGGAMDQPTSRAVEPAATAAPATPATVDSPASASPAEHIFAKVSGSVARVNVQDASGRAVGFGSGVVIDRGIVLTNCHVALRGTAVAAKLGNDVYPAIVQVADEELDLCTLSVPGLDAPAVPIGSVKTLRTGQRVFAIGAPQGLELTISEGIVSSLREVPGGTVIQTTAAISAGSSGGGLFDVSGKLVGIPTFTHRYGQNLNFALPADWIGEMRTRSTPSASAPAARTPVADTGRADDPRRLIVGRWWCFGSISGRNGEYDYRDDGSVLVASSDGLRLHGRYSVSGQSVRYAISGASFSFAIESLSPEKMVLNIGDRGQRLACDRKSG